MGHFGDPKSRLKSFRANRFETNAIHGGQFPDPATGAVMPPIFQTSTYAQKAPGETISGYEYSRTHNPTRRMLEDCLALLEGGTYGLAMSSGMSAVQLVLSLLASGDHVICCDDVYGGTYRLFTKVASAQGLAFSFLDLAKNPIQALETAVQPSTKLVWIETPTNPLLKLIDIQTISTWAKSRGILVVVDNTFMSPYFQKPLALGATMVLHSMTKYIGGHSDVVGGCLVLQDDALAERLYFNQNSIGAILGPFDSWLVLRSLKTLPVRMQAHERNAKELAHWLSEHPKVERVIYPGLESHPQHELAKKQMSGFGGMISVYVKGDLNTARQVLSSVALFTLAESLGGVESLIEHPAIMTHASVPPEIRRANGISDNFIRLSVGLESISDLKTDLDQALSR